MTADIVGEGGHCLVALDLKIVEILRATPRASNPAVAFAAGVAELTAGIRIRNLIERGSIRIVGRDDLAMRGRRLVAHVDIHVWAGRLDEVLAALVKVDRLLVVDVVTGPSPVMAVFSACDLDDVLEVCERDIGSIVGVQRIETHVTVEPLPMASAFERA